MMLLRESRSSMVLNENDNHFCTYAIMFTQYNFEYIIGLDLTFVNGQFPDHRLLKCKAVRPKGRRLSYDLFGYAPTLAPDSP